jgi:hypothetical protein
VLATSDNTFTVTWFSQEGTRYGVQMKALWADTWQDYSPTILATDALTSLQLTAPLDSPCFIRVRTVQ